MSYKFSSKAGDSLTRLAIVLASAKGRDAQLVVAESRYGRNYPEIASYLKAAMAAGNLSDANFAGPLSNYRSMATEYVALVRAETVLGRMTAARRVALKQPIAVEGTPVQAHWRSEGAAKPVGSIRFSPTSSLEPKTASALIVVSNDLLRFSGSEDDLKQSLVRGVAHHLDQSALDPDNAGTGGAPASLTYGATQVTPTGTTALLISADLKSLMVAVGNACEFRAPVFILSPLTAGKLAALRDSQGGAAFPQINAVSGGVLCGIPVLLSTAARGFDSPTNENIVLLDAAEVIIADDDGLSLDVSTEVTVEMSNTPTQAGTVPTASSVVSLWQAGLVGLRVERSINFALARSNAVASLPVTF